MSHWQQYVKNKKFYENIDAELDSQDPVNKFKFNGEDEDYAEDYEKIEKELFGIVMRKYPNESIDFLNTLASRGDQEVSSLLRKLKKEKSSNRLPREPRHPTDGHEVAPSLADTGHNPDEGGGE